MAFAYLTDPEKQFMTKSGTINVDGFLKVFDAVTDDPAVTYKDFAGTENPERITLDNNGRAVVIADADRAYRLEVYDRYGTLMWTTTPLWCLPGGGGADLMSIISSDYSIAVDKTTVGSLTTFDLTVAKDSTEMLEWLKTEGYTSASGTMVPTYHEGTMQVGQRGIIMHADRYYHVTARLATSTQLQPLYNEFNLTFKGIDAEDNVYTFRDDRLIIDCSTELHQDFEVSFDIIPETDIELYADVTGLAYGVSVGLTDVQVHRVYSGAPSVPDSVATRTWVEEHFQEILSGGPGIELSGNYIAVDFDDVQQKLEAGANIDITGNVISAIVPEYATADWDATSGEPGYIANKPDLDQYATDAELAAGLETKQGTLTAGTNITIDSNNVISATGGPSYSAGTGIDITNDVISVDTTTIATKSDLSAKQDVISDLSDIRDGAALGATSVQDVTIDNVSVVNAQGVAEIPRQVNADWNSSAGASEILNKPDLSQYATQTDLAEKQDVLTAGDNITIVNNVISATAAPQLNADWDATSGVQEILHKPDLSQYATQTDLAGKQDTLTAGSNITIVNDVISATAAPQVNADWDATSGVQEILNKPDLSVYATQTDLAGKQDTLTAGSNITITNNVISAAADPQVNADWDATSGVAKILNKPSIPTSTSDLQNDSGFITAADEAVKDVQVGGVSVVDAQGIANISIPQTGVQDVEVDGVSVVDQQGVAEITLPVVPPLKELTAGTNIAIVESASAITISATDTTYSAGTGIDIANDTIGVDTATVALKSDLPVIGTITL